MSEIRSTLKLKKSTVSGEAPLPEELEVAELALNVADRKLYSKDDQGTVIELFGQNREDIPYQPVPFARSQTPVTPATEAFVAESSRTTALPPIISEGDLLVAVVATRDGNRVTCSDPGYEVLNQGVPYLQNMATDFSYGPQVLSVLVKRASASEPATVTFDRPDWDAADNSEMMSVFMVCVANTQGISGIVEQYEDGITCGISADKFRTEAFHIAAYTHIFSNDPPTTTSFSASGMSNIYTPGYNARLSYSTLVTPASTQTFTHRTDSSSSTYLNNHSAIVIAFTGPEGIEVNAPVKSVQGKIGDVRLNLSEMDDVSLVAEAGSEWDTQVTVAPSADGEFRIDLNTPTFYTVDASGRDMTGDLRLLGTGRSFWLSEDRISWTVYTPTAEPVEDAVAGTIQLTLDVNFIPTGGKVYISWEDPSVYSLSNGDSLIWNDSTQLWEAKRPEDAVKRIDDLIDVDTSTTAAEAGDVLEWNGSSWVPGDGSSIVSVTSVNGQSGVVELGIKDMTDYFSEGNSLEFFYNDVLANDLVPSGQGQWSKINDNELVFNDRSFTGTISTNAGPIMAQLTSGSSVWLSENGVEWTEFLLTQDPATLAGVVKSLKIDGAGWASTQESVYISFQPPSTIEPLIPEDQSLITYDSSKQKYVPGPPAVKKIVDFQDVDKGAGFNEGDALLYDSARNLWVPSEVEPTTVFTFIQYETGGDILIAGPGLNPPLEATWGNQYTQSNNSSARRFPISVERGKTYVFDLSQINFVDETEDNIAVRPWILTEQGGRMGRTANNQGPIDPIAPSNVQAIWNPTTRLFRVTIPQTHAWDRYFIGLGSNCSWWESYGVWTLLPPNNAPISNTCLGWFAIDLTEVEQDGFIRYTTQVNSDGTRQLSRRVVPYVAEGNWNPHQWPVKVNRYNPYGNSGAQTGVPETIRAVGPSAGNPSELGRVEMRLVMPQPFDRNSFDNSFIVETLSDGPTGRSQEEFTQDFFIHNISSARGYELTIDFHNVTGTKVLPDMFKVTMFQTPSMAYRGL